MAGNESAPPPPPPPDGSLSLMSKRASWAQKLIHRWIHESTKCFLHFMHGRSRTIILFLSVTRAWTFFHCNRLCRTKGGGVGSCNFYTLGKVLFYLGGGGGGAGAFWVYCTVQYSLYLPTGSRHTWLYALPESCAIKCLYNINWLYNTTYSESFQVTTPLYAKLLFRNSVLGLGGRRHDTLPRVSCECTSLTFLNDFNR